jgi:hypothetical protein
LVCTDLGQEQIGMPPGANATMGRPKKSADQRKPTVPRTVGVRASGEWAAWIERAAKHCRTDVAKLIDNAVVEYAKARGFEEIPPERIP